MDLQRFALVPLPPSLGGPSAAATAWDTYWGTCLNLGDPSLFCSNDPAAPSLPTGIASGQGKVTQDGAPDDQRIAIPADSRGSFPDGAYQIVAISNPYGLLTEAGTTSGSVACTQVQLANAPAYAGFTATPVAAAPATCYVPRTLPAALAGPGGRDPMASAGPTTPPCTIMPASGHCWATVPMAGANPPAVSNTNATAAATIVGTDLVPVPQGADYRVNPTPPVAATGHAALDPPADRLQLEGARAHRAAPAVRPQPPASSRVLPCDGIDQVDLHGALEQEGRELSRQGVPASAHGEGSTAVAVSRGRDQAQEREDAANPLVLQDRGNRLRPPQLAVCASGIPETGVFWEDAAHVKEAGTATGCRHINCRRTQGGFSCNH